jgi:hypothetical protein
MTLWEAAVLNEPIIVLGSTPSRASKAVRALGQLLAPFVSPSIFPYIALTDPRFEGIMENPIGIIGVSNPIVPAIIKREVRVISVGFPSANRRHSLCSQDNKGRVNSRQLRQNTENLIMAIRAVNYPRRNSDTAPDLAVIKQSLLAKGVETSMKMDTFVSRLVTVPLFHSLRADRNQMPAL